MKKSTYYLLGNIGQWLAFSISLIGIILLTIFDHNYSALFISCGSLAFGIATKIKYYSGMAEIKRIKGQAVSIDDLLKEHNITPVREIK